MVTPLDVAALLLCCVIAYLFGWAAGRSSGKVAAIEAAHDIDLSNNGGER